MYTHSGNHAEKQEGRNQCIDPETSDVQVETCCFQNTKLGDMTIVAEKQESQPISLPKAILGGIGGEET